MQNCNILLTDSMYLYVINMRLLTKAAGLFKLKGLWDVDLLNGFAAYSSHRKCGWGEGVSERDRDGVKDPCWKSRKWLWELVCFWRLELLGPEQHTESSCYTHVIGPLTLPAASPWKLQVMLLQLSHLPLPDELLGKKLTSSDPTFSHAADCRLYSSTTCWHTAVLGMRWLLKLTADLWSATLDRCALRQGHTKSTVGHWKAVFERRSASFFPVCSALLALITLRLGF